jgi:hypothetical protein
MKLNLIRRICAMAALSAVALTGVIVSADPLPVPEPLTPRLSLYPSVTIVGPLTGETVTYGIFVWVNEMPDKYIVKLKIMETGKTFNVAVDSCVPGGNCHLEFGNVPFLSQLRDGQSLRWQVVARYGADKVKSTPQTVTMDTVNAPTQLSPANGQELLPVHQLVWDHTPANMYYTLFVKNGAGKVIIKHTLSYYSCNVVCAVNPYLLADLNAKTTYRWTVRAEGGYGQKIESAKQTFKTPIGKTW